AVGHQPQRVQPVGGQAALVLSLPITKDHNQQKYEDQHRDNQQCDLPNTVRTVALDLAGAAVDDDLKQLAVVLISAGVNRQQQVLERDIGIASVESLDRLHVPADVTM